MFKPMLRKTPEHSRRERGSAMLEAALSLTVFLMILFGTIDFGRMVFAYNSTSYLAREATRYAAVRGTTNPATTSSISSFVTSEAVGLPSSLITVTPTWTPDHSAGSKVQVTVSYAFTPLIPWLRSSAITLSSTSQMLISQ